MTPEGILKADVVAALNKAGVFYLRIQSGQVKVRGAWMHLAPTGTADVICFSGGRVVWLELKAPGQKTAKERAIKQAEFRDRALSAGHCHAMCTSVEEVMRAIRDAAIEEVA